MLGFSLNNLTLFGLVLAIGIVVDDAIVVVEAVEHHVERGMAPRAATDPSHAGGLRPGHRHRPGAHRRLRPLRLHHRHRRPVLPPVRPDHRHLHGHLRLQQSLTLSPALAALLIKPKDPTGPKQSALPRLALLRNPGGAYRRLRVPGTQRHSCVGAAAPSTERMGLPGEFSLQVAGAIGLVAGVGRLGDWVAVGPGFLVWFFGVFNKAGSGWQRPGLFAGGHRALPTGQRRGVIDALRGPCST